MGAWETLRPCLLELIPGRWPLHCVARPPSSSPAKARPVFTLSINAL